MKGDLSVIICRRYRLHVVAEKLDSSSQSHIFKYLLTIEPTEMDDTAEYTCKVGRRSTKGKLTVDEGKLQRCNLHTYKLLTRNFNI